MQLPILKHFFSDGDPSNENIRWEKLPVKTYIAWAALSIVLIAIIYHFNLLIPLFSAMIYFLISAVLHCILRKYIGISIRKPDPSFNEIIRLWLKRIGADSNVSEQDKTDSCRFGEQYLV